MQPENDEPLVVDPSQLDAVAPTANRAGSPSSAIAAPQEAPNADAVAPFKSYSLDDLGTPDLTAEAPSLSADLERPLTAVRGMFGLPQLSSESANRVAAEERKAADARIKNASIGPRPNDFATEADNVADDIRYGKTVTPVGSLLHAMGAEGTATGEPEGVADFFGGPVEGPFRVKAGLAKLAEEPGNRLAGGNEAVRGAMQTLMPVAAATEPEFLATLPAYAGAGEAAQYGLERAGVDPQIAEMISNAALLSASGIHGAEPEGAFGSTLDRDMAASEPVVEREPPVPPGMKRLYHGSAQEGRYTGKAWFSTDKEYARNYRPGAELQYVDIPLDEWRQISGEDLENGIAGRSSVELDSSETGPRKPLAVEGNTVPDYLSNVRQRIADQMEATKQQEIQAGRNARQEMEREARINAPVQAPPTPETTEPPPILPKPAAKTPMQELSEQAQQVRDAQEFRRSLTQELTDEIEKRLRDEGVFEPSASEFSVTDRRVVRPEDLEPISAPEPQRKFVGTPGGATSVVPQGRLLRDMLENERPGEPQPIEQQPAQKLLSATPPATLEAMRAEQERYDTALAAAREKAKGPVYAPEPTPAPDEISADSRRVGNLFVGRFRDREQKAFAQSVWRAMLDGEEPPAPEMPVSFRDGRYIRDKLARIAQGDLGRPVDPTAVYPPDVLEDARNMMDYTNSAMQELPKAGRKIVNLAESLDDRPEYMVQSVRSPRWQFDWFKDLPFSPADLEKAVARGKGVTHDRILTAAAEWVTKRRAEVRDAALRNAPDLHELSQQVREIDPELANFLAEAAEGRLKTEGDFSRRIFDTIDSRISDARAAAQFASAVDDLAAEEERENPDAEAGAGDRNDREDRGGRSTEENRGGEGVLPGLAEHLDEERRAVAQQQGKSLSDEINRPAESISEAAGDMERESPLFRDSGASGQSGLFGRQREESRSLADELEAEATAPRKKYTSPAGSPSDEAVREAFPTLREQVRDWTRTGTLDETITPGMEAKTIIRQRSGERARAREQARDYFRKAFNEWDGRSKQDFIDFATNMAHGDFDKMSEKDAALAHALNDQLFEPRKRQIEELGHGAYDTWRENYFPGLYERQGEVRDWVKRQIYGKKPFQGSGAFRKQKVFDDMQEAIKAGFKPLTWNPVEMALLKADEMDKYIMAHKAFDDFRKQGLAVAGNLGRQRLDGKGAVPDDWRRPNDSMFEMRGAGKINVPEYFDELAMNALRHVAENLGIEIEREPRIGGQMAGFAEKGGGVAVRTGTPDSVLAHEIGHQLDWKYGLWDKVQKVDGARKELRALADLRYEGQEASGTFKDYVRKKEEKMAVMLEAMIHAPDKFRSVAPNTFKWFQNFLGEHNELRPLLDVKPSLVLGGGNVEHDLGGYVVHGHYYMPPDAARVFDNYLSPGLTGKLRIAYDWARNFGNAMNQAQLGLSGFHVVGSAINAMVSDFAMAIEHGASAFSEGKSGDLSEAMYHAERAAAAAGRAATLFGSPAHYALLGNRLLTEYLRPGTYAELSKLADAVAQSGGRAFMDQQYTGQWSRRFMQAVKGGDWGKAGLRAIPAVIEKIGMPVMQYAVPRMKLGAFARLAEPILRDSEREGWDQAKTSRELDRAWNSVDGRFGQVVYDNVFVKKMAKDLAFGAFRSAGWAGGTIAELGGGSLDAGRQLARLATREAPALTHRMAYAIALPLAVGYAGALAGLAMTGKAPHSLRDLYAIPTGQRGDDGRQVYVNLPTYMKDVLSFAHSPAQWAWGKRSPLVESITDWIENHDYRNVRIVNPNDPLAVQLRDGVEHMLKSFIPFSVENMLERKQAGGGIGADLESFFGVTPAPHYTTADRAESEMQRYFEGTGAVRTKRAIRALAARTRNRIRSSPRQHGLAARCDRTRRAYAPRGDERSARCSRNLVRARVRSVAAR